jgi:hypothetical protein
MATYQGVIFQTAGVAGWSSVYYINAASLAAAMTLLQNINSKQLEIQSNAVFSQSLRVSDVSIKGDGLIAVPTSNQGQLLITPPDTLAPVNLAQRVLFATADGLGRVNHYIHGLRQSDTATDVTGRTITTAVYRALAGMTDYTAAVISDSVNWRKRSIPPVTQPLSTSTVVIDTSIRRVGRPFDLFRGRRRVA